MCFQKRNDPPFRLSPCLDGWAVFAPPGAHALTASRSVGPSRPPRISQSPSPSLLLPTAGGQRKAKRVREAGTFNDSPASGSSRAPSGGGTDRVERFRNRPTPQPVLTTRCTPCTRRESTPAGSAGAGRPGWEAADRHTVGGRSRPAPGDSSADGEQHPNERVVVLVVRPTCTHSARPPSPLVHCWVFSVARAFFRGRARVEGRSERAAAGKEALVRSWTDELGAACVRFACMASFPRFCECCWSPFFWRSVPFPRLKHCLKQ